MEPQVRIQDNNRPLSDSDEATISNPESSTDSSLNSSSIEVIQPNDVIQPNQGLKIRLPINPPQRVPPNLPENPRTNVAVLIPDGLLTEDEEAGDQVVPPTVVTETQNPQVR